MATQLFNSLDLNADGKVDLEEFTVGFDKYKAVFGNEYEVCQTVTD